MGDEHGIYFQQLFERVNSAVKVPFRKVLLNQGEPRLNDCHGNVDCWIKTHPETKAVRGWLFWPPDATGHYRFMAHSVLDENGELIDITPIDPNTPPDGLVFLRHEGTEEAFSAMKTACSEVVYPPLTYDEWHESQIAELEDTDLLNG